MKYTFETDDQVEAKCLMNAMHLYSALWNIHEEIRRILKHEDLELPVLAKVCAIRAFIDDETEGLLGD